MLQLKYSDYFLDAAIPLCVVKTELGNSHFPEHRHEFYELVVVCKGKGFHVLEGESMNAEAGDVFLIRPGMVHNYPEDNTLELVNILFDQNRLWLKDDDLSTIPGYNILFAIEPQLRHTHKLASCLKLNTAMLLQVEHETNLLCEEIRQKPPGYRTTCICRFKTLLAIICRDYTQRNTPESSMALRLAEAVSYLETSFHNPINIDKLAEIAHMSRSVFYRTFKTVYGKTPLSYLAELRMEYATQLLRSTDLPITQIAFNAGYRDSNYFSRAFHAAHGTSPRQFRKTTEPGFPY